MPPKKTTDGKGSSAGSKHEKLNKEDYEKLEAKVKRLQAQCSMLRNNFDFEKVQTECKTFDIQAMLTEENKALNERVNELESALKKNASSNNIDTHNKQTDVENGMTNETPEMQKLRSEIAKKDAAMQQIQKKLDEAESKLKEKEVAETKQETEKLKLQQQLEAANREIDELKQDKKSNPEKVDEAKKDNKEKSQASGKDDSDIAKQLKEMTDSVEKLQTDLADREKTIDGLRKANDELENKLKEAIETIDTLKKTKTAKDGKDANQTEVKDRDTKTAKDQELKNKEIQLKNEEVALKTREEDVKGKEESQKQRENTTSTKEKQLEKREDSIREKEAQLDKTSAEVMKKEKAVKDKESQLRKQEEELQRSKDGLENRQRTLTQSEIKLEEKKKSTTNNDDAKDTLSKDDFKKLEDDLKDKESEIEKLNKKWSEKESKGREALRNKDSEIEKLKKKLNENERNVQDLQAKISNLEKPRGGNKTSSSARSYKRELDQANLEIEELKTRLSKVVGAQITDGNPDIADLSDLNRPTKLAERYAELYDNEWTDAYEEIEGNGKEEVDVIKQLLETLKDVYKFCQDVSKDYESGIKTSALVIPGSAKGRPKTPKLTSTSRKQIVELRKTFAPTLTEDVFTQFLKTLKKSVDKSPKTKLYMKTCIEICWLMSIQDPPVVLDTDDPKGAFDGDRYRTYTRSGKTFDYVVWPPMRLHEAGALLGKGVAQAK